MYQCFLPLPLCWPAIDSNMVSCWVILFVFVIISVMKSAFVYATLPFGLPTSEGITTSRKTDETPSSLLSDRDFESGNTGEDYLETDIVIVGGGLVGLALFIGTARLPDCRVLLIEKRSQYERAGATLGLAANGVKALNELASDPTFVQTNIHPHGFDMMPVEQVPTHILPWWIVRDALLDRAVQLAKAQAQTDNAQESPHRLEMWNGVELSELDEYDDCVELGFSNVNVRVRAKLVVAADGVRSQIRSLLQLKPAEDTGVRVWRGHIQVMDLKGKNEEAYRVLEPLLSKGYAPFVVRDPNNPLSYVAVFNHHENIPGLLLWQLGTPSDDDDTITQFLSEGITDPAQREVLAALCSHTPNILYTKLRTINMDHISAQPAEQQVQGWGGSKRVTLIGDAAHACRPTDGQGANMAFEDACVLVRLLQQTLEKDGPAAFLQDIQDLVLRFENERRPRVKRIHQDQAERAHKQGNEWTRWSPEMMDFVYKGV